MLFRSMQVDNQVDNQANYLSLQDFHQFQNHLHPESPKASSTMTRQLTSCHPDVNKVILRTRTTPTPVPMTPDEDDLKAQIREIRSTPRPTHLAHWGPLLLTRPTFRSTWVHLRPTYQPTRPTTSLEHSHCLPAPSRLHDRLHPNAPKSENPTRSTAPILRNFNPS